MENSIAIQLRQLLDFQLQRQVTLLQALNAQLQQAASPAPNPIVENPRKRSAPIEKPVDNHDSAEEQTELKADKDGKFECPICHKKFSRRWYVLGSHRPMHLGEKPFNCAVCSKEFNYRSNCRAHEKICGPKKQDSDVEPANDIVSPAVGEEATPRKLFDLIVIKTEP
jgi:hypothetical protein